MKKHLLISVATAWLSALVACSADSGVDPSSNNEVKENATPSESNKLEKPTYVLNENALDYLNSSRTSSNYVVVIDESGTETFEEMKALLSETYEVRVIHTYVDDIWFEKDSVKVDLSELESNRNECAKGILKTVMPSKYADQFRIVSIDTEYSFSENEETKVSGYTFNFKRVFNGRVVRNNKNLLSIYTDQDGHVHDGQISLQDLKVTSDSLKIDANIEENKATLDSMMSENFYSFSVCQSCGSDPENVRITEVNVTSAADAYCEVLHGSETKLLPCISYTTNEILENGDSIARIVDAPYSRSSWNDYDHGEKHFEFNRYSH